MGPYGPNHATNGTMAYRKSYSDTHEYDEFVTFSEEISFLEHHIRIETNNQVSPQIELDYKKGYDKLVAGINFHQFIGYAFMANAGFINFYGGVYFQQGFTKNQRSIFYTDPTSPVSQAVRNDFNYGLKVGWLIPIYKRKPKEYYFN